MLSPHQVTFEEGLKFMKAHVLFDEGGQVHGVLLAMPRQKGGKENLAKEPTLTARAHERQRLATLEIPRELEELKPVELHKRLRVETTGGSLRLVAKSDAA